MNAVDDRGPVKERRREFRLSEATALRLTESLGWTGKQITRRFENAGMTYNTGNWGTIIGAAAQFVVTAHGDVVEVARGLAGYFVGNRPSVEATLGSLAFFYGGRKYDQAWANGFPPDQSKNNQGHFWSAVGAGFLAKGLVSLSRTGFAYGAALTGGVLHVGGKVGSLWDPKHDAFYKWLPLLSRAPAVASLVEDIHHNAISYPPLQAAAKSILPASLIVCNAIWARADVMLMPEGRTKRMLGRTLLVPGVGG